MEGTPHTESSGAVAILIDDDARVEATDTRERPRLADGVQLVGELSGGGFKDRQWLVMKGERFVQVSELLYRVLELADGTRTVAELASQLGSAIGRGISAENVEYLLREKLIPMGLIGGLTHPGAGASARPGGRQDDEGKLLRSALDVNFRMRVRGSQVEPLARPLTLLHRPAVLVPVLAAVAVVHGWLYGVHGVTGLLRDAVTNPDLVLVIIPVMLAASVFHEFGHASALLYEGGRVRSMGAGFYLAFPALYTDVTDAYRLSRRARVRVDVAGPYFHLVAGLVLFAMYLATGSAYWLLLVVLTDIEVVRQFMPVGRLDGYWTLADVSGIPDYYSRMVPELARLVGAPIPDSMRTAELTQRARRLFLAYALVLLIALPVFLIYFFTHLPGFSEVGWHAAQDRVEMLRLSFREGDVATGLSAAFQLGFLLLEAAVMALFIYLVTWRPAKKLWMLGRTRHPFFRRMTRGAVLVAGGAAGVLIGSLLPWRQFHLTGMQLSRTFNGLTWLHGRTMVVGTIVALVAAVMMMLSWNLRVKRWASIAAVGLGSAAAALSIVELARADTLTAAWIRETLQESLGHTPSAAELGTVHQLMSDLGFSITAGYGLFIVATGSLLAVAGGIVALTARPPTAESMRAHQSLGEATVKPQPSRAVVRAAALGATVAMVIGAAFIAFGVPTRHRPSQAAGTSVPSPEVIYWPPEPAELGNRARALGFPLLTQEALAFHTHQHLQVYVHGRQVPVPAGIGISPQDGLITVLHTHEADGVIHVEAPQPHRYTLGQFFRLWGVRLTPHCLATECRTGQTQVRVFVNGEVVTGDPRNIPLVDGDTIIVTYGTPDELPPTDQTTPTAPSAD